MGTEGIFIFRGTTRKNIFRYVSEEESQPAMHTHKDITKPVNVHNKARKETERERMRWRERESKRGEKRESAEKV